MIAAAGEGVVGNAGARDVAATVDSGATVGSGLDGSVRGGEPGGVVSRGADVGASVRALGVASDGEAVGGGDGARVFVDADAIWLLGTARRSVAPSLDVPDCAQALAIVRRSASVARDTFGLRAVSAFSIRQRLSRCNSAAITVATRSEPRGVAR